MIAPPYQQLAYKKNKKQQLIIDCIVGTLAIILLKSEEKTIIHVNVDRYR
jgi:hypothetical protein